MKKELSIYPSFDYSLIYSSYIYFEFVIIMYLDNYFNFTVKIKKF